MAFEESQRWYTLRGEVFVACDNAGRKGRRYDKHPKL
jgi:hypothetical protein